MNAQQQHQYIPISIAVPVFASVVAIPVPDKAIPGDLWGVIQSTNSFTIRQHLKLLPKNCCGCPPCAPQENTFSVYAGLNQNAQSEVMRIDEVSDDWNRCCCKPYHPVTMEVRQYVPLPGDGTSSDYSHIGRDLADSWGTLSARDQQLRAREIYKQYEPVMSFVRYDGQRCCKFPCRCLSTAVCFECCQEGFDVYAGGIMNDPEDDIGRHQHLEYYQQHLIGSVKQPIFGGCCHPLLELRSGNNLLPKGKENGSTDPFAKFEGPCFFGGWSECCCDFYFPLTRWSSNDKSGDLGGMVKQHPRSLAGGLRSLVAGDNSVFTMQFDANSNLDASQKSTVLAAEILYDYMLFDGTTEKCSQDDNAIYCYICYCSIIGMLIPFTIVIPKKAG